MAHVIADRVKESTATTGVGALTLDGALTAYRTFDDVCNDADTVYYAIEAVDANGLPTGDWEVGLGTYSAGTLTRTAPSASSNGGAAVNFAAGTKHVWIDATAAQIAAFLTAASLASPPAIGGTTPAAGSFTTATVTQIVTGLGSAGTPALISTDADSGLFWTTNTNLSWGTNSAERIRFASGGQINLTGGLTLGSSIASPDAAIHRASANSILFNGAAGAVTTTSRTETNKTVTAFTDGVAKAVFTITIPNGNHSASLRVKLIGAIGAGGAVGVHEGDASVWHDIDITRTTGANAVATLGAAYGGTGGASVAGGTGLTTAVTISAIAGAAGAANTFTVNGTVTKVGGTSDNHIVMGTGELANFNASGVTIA